MGLGVARYSLMGKWEMGLGVARYSLMKYTSLPNK
jgi:hypothetical protein